MLDLVKTVRLVSSQCDVWNKQTFAHIPPRNMELICQKIL